MMVNDTDGDQQATKYMAQSEAGIALRDKDGVSYGEDGPKSGPMKI